MTSASMSFLFPQLGEALVENLLVRFAQCHYVNVGQSLEEIDMSVALAPDSSDRYADPIIGAAGCGHQMGESG